MNDDHMEECGDIGFDDIKQVRKQCDKFPWYIISYRKNIGILFLFLFILIFEML